VIAVPGFMCRMALSITPRFQSFTPTDRTMVGERVYGTSSPRHVGVLRIIWFYKQHDEKKCMYGGNEERMVMGGNLTTKTKAPRQWLCMILWESKKPSQQEQEQGARIKKRRALLSDFETLALL
jgi:hypothetical protein